MTHLRGGWGAGQSPPNWPPIGAFTRPPTAGRRAGSRVKTHRPSTALAMLVLDMAGDNDVSASTVRRWVLEVLGLLAARARVWTVP